MKDKMKERREEIDNIVDMANYKSKKYKNELSEDSKKELEKAKDLIKDEGKSKKKGGK